MFFLVDYQICALFSIRHPRVLVRLLLDPVFSSKETIGEVWHYFQYVLFQMYGGWLPSLSACVVVPVFVPALAAERGGEPRPVKAALRRRSLRAPRCLPPAPAPSAHASVWVPFLIAELLGNVQQFVNLHQVYE